MAQTGVPLIPCKSLTPELRSRLAERTNLLLLKIVRANLNSQYASKTPSLTGFRDAISAHGTDSDTGLLEVFQVHVPLSDYESYRPFMAKFEERPCMKSKVLNMFAPGLPNFLTISSATSGKEPKLLAKYHAPPLRPSFGGGGLMAAIFNYGYREIKEVKRHGDPDQIVKRIAVCLGSSGVMRGETDDERMPLIMPGYVAPWAASVIKYQYTTYADLSGTENAGSRATKGSLTEMHW